MHTLYFNWDPLDSKIRNAVSEKVVLDATCYLPSATCTRGVEWYEMQSPSVEGDYAQQKFNIWTDGSITIKDKDSLRALSVEDDGKISFNNDKSKWLILDF